jgi:hypothetical protein
MQQQQQQLFAVLASAAAAVTNLSSTQIKTRVEILGQFGSFEILGRLLPFLNQVLCNCTKVAIDRHQQHQQQQPQHQTMNQQTQQQTNTAAPCFPPETEWISFCDDVDKELEATNLAKALAKTGFFLFFIIQVVLLAVMGFGGITLDLYVFFLPVIPALVLAVKVRSMTLRAVQQVRNVCDNHSHKSDGSSFHYALEEEVYRRGSGDNITFIRKYYIMVYCNNTTTTNINNSSSLQGNMMMGVGGNNESNHAATTNTYLNSSSTTTNGAIGGVTSMFDQLSKK